MSFKRLAYSVQARARLGWQTIQNGRAKPRAENPYATCIPVLVGLSKLLPVKTVLEFGAGIYSTSLFLNREAFALLEKLCSFENDYVWASKVLESSGQDSRLVLQCLDLPMYQIANAADLAEQDIIFIDDSNNASDRSQTIGSVMRRITAPTVAVIHDIEVPQYQQAVAENNLDLGNMFIFDALTPNTCVLWGNGTINRSSLARLNKIISRRSKDLSPDDVSGWVEVIGNERKFRSRRKF